MPALLTSMGRSSRDHARTPMQWDPTDQAGFTSGLPWLAVNPDHKTVNAAAQVDDPDSVFAHHQRLIALRHEDPVVTDGEFELLLPDHEQVWAFLRRGADTDLLVAANFSGLPVDVTLPLDDWAAASLVLGNLPDADRPVLPALALRPWESLVLRRVH